MLVFMAVAVALALIIELVSLRNAFRGLIFDVRPERTYAEPDEEVSLILTAENTSRLPKNYLRFSVSLPEDAAVREDDGAVSLRGRGEGKRLVASMYLFPRRRTVRSVPISFPCRGRRFLRGADMSGGDFLGLSEKTEHLDYVRELVILPRPSDDENAIRALGGFLGDVSVRRFIFEDPVLTLGYREYTGAEPMKNISWTQSSRTDDLMVKSFDYTLEPTATVVLCTELPEQRTAAAAALLEECFSLARTACELLDSGGIKYGFITNARAAGAEEIWPASCDGLGREHLLSILEGLGRATYMCSEPFEATLERAARAAEHGRSHVIIIPGSPERYAHALTRLRLLSGGELCVVTPKADER